MASNPNLVALGAPQFTGAGHSLIGFAGNPVMGTTSISRANVNGTVARPLLKPSFESDIYLINGDTAALLALTQRGPFAQIETDADIHEWTEDRMPPEKTTATGSTAVGGTSLSVTYVDMFIVGATVWVPDAGDAYGRCSAVTGAGTGGPGTLTVAWFAGMAPTAAITAGTDVYCIGNTQAEYYVPVSLPITDKVQKYCVMQEFTFAQELSKRVQKSKFQIGGDELAFEREKLRKEAELQIEKTKWFGQQSWAAATGIGTMEGVYYATGARRVNFGAVALTQAAFLDAIDRLRRHRYGGELGETWAWCSTSVRRQLSQFPAANLRLQVGEERYGININRWISDDGKGDVILTTSPIFDALGRDDLMILMRMDPKAIFNVRSALYPSLMWTDGVVPLNGSWDTGAYFFRGSQLFKDAFGHIEVIYNIGAASGTLI